jgi:hypothetical protein
MPDPRSWQTAKDPTRSPPFSTAVSSPWLHDGPKVAIVAPLASDTRTPRPTSFASEAAKASRLSGSFQAAANCSAMKWRARS